MTIKSFADAHAALAQYYAYSSATGPYTLDRMRQLLAAIGDPQNDLRVIHVAGTSGKTSTSYYVAAILQQVGLKVGLTVSPHVDEVNERVQVDLVPMPEAAFCSALEAFLMRVQESAIKPSYFELLVAFAYDQFRRQDVDYAVIETGLGGLLDGTNTVDREDKLCIITDIGYDHTEVLGNTLGEIAAQKAGIIQRHNDVFMYEQSDEVMEPIRRAVAKAAGRLHCVTAATSGLANELPAFQQRNFTLAVQAVSYLLDRDGRPPLTDAQRRTAATVYIPARIEEVKLPDGRLIIDGAHNAQKLETLLQSLQTRFGDQPTVALLAFVDGDPSRWQRALDALLPHLEAVIFTSYHVAQDVIKHAVDPERLAVYAKEHGYHNVSVEPDTTKAYGLLLRQDAPLKLVTGSFYLIHAMRPFMSSTEKTKPTTL